MPSDRSRDGDLGFSRADTEDKWSRRSPATGHAHSFRMQEYLLLQKLSLLQSAVTSVSAILL